MIDARQVLRANRLFKNFGDNGIVIVGSICEPRRYPPGSPIFVAKQPAESMFIIERGEVQIELQVGSDCRPLGRLGVGDHLGQLALLCQGERQVSAVAVTECSALEIGRRNFLKLQAVKPQACLKLMLAIWEDYLEAARAAVPALQRLLIARQARPG
ncbi:MAG: cyclic nucleotide-binding domain-containing protein [Deltaproteobacteria bacterium]|nr:cyclic nucleotide-binding domain-containing protein [Deltaproteobacteria bacterium]